MLYHQLIIGGVSALLVAVTGVTIIKFLRPRWLALIIALSITIITAFLIILNTLALSNSYFGYSAFEIISTTWAYPPTMILFTLIPTKHNKTISSTNNNNNSTTNG